MLSCVFHRFLCFIGWMNLHSNPSHENPLCPEIFLCSFEKTCHQIMNDKLYGKSKYFFLNKKGKRNSFPPVTSTIFLQRPNHFSVVQISWSNGYVCGLRSCEILVSYARERKSQMVTLHHYGKRRKKKYKKSRYNGPGQTVPASNDAKEWAKSNKRKGHKEKVRLLLIMFLKGRRCQSQSKRS